ncbi:diamine N-acetyltransferase [Cytobacillus oceanisediminis]|uniref:Diamine N-acetyltransferase n=1 Tax=Cytobacillus oceanisediminis TaxID=665099 RepID=A0A2V3A5G8_9BACI|nr:GNAT family N-acetyltransferase [Cytobacillus oceanisediminis]PWW31798.1 diamine N-acetyltransferase [Cytobacillus oceanisediminis]
MEIRFKEITYQNWEECIGLQVADHQKGFIASNLYSIAEVQFLPGFKAMGIYYTDVMIGFIMFGLDPDDGNYWIYRFMIDEKFQRKGYGKQALIQAAAMISNNPGCQEIYVGYHQDNIAADRLYKSTGFTDKGIAPWGERLAGYIKM